jgi:putative transposase
VPVVAAVAAASVDRRVPIGPRKGARVRRSGNPPEELAPTTLGPCHARADGFDLHAGLVVRAGHRDRLERVCRDALRPPLALERLHRTSDGEIWLTLRHRWSDGTTHLRVDPLELLERLAVLTPRPRVNLVLYYGVLAPRALSREAIVPRTANGVDVREEAAAEDGDASGETPSRTGAYQWAELMRRTFGVDVRAVAVGCASWR